MDTNLLISKLFELQKLTSRKAELVLEYSWRYALNCRSDVSRDLSLHVREHHHGRFNVEYDLQNQRMQRDELQEMRDEYDEVCERIRTLETEVEQAIAVRI